MEETEQLTERWQTELPGSFMNAGAYIFFDQYRTVFCSWGSCVIVLARSVSFLFTHDISAVWEFRKMFVGLLIVEVGKSPGKELAIFRIKHLSFWWNDIQLSDQNIIIVPRSIKTWCKFANETTVPFVVWCPLFKSKSRFWEEGKKNRLDLVFLVEKQVSIMTEFKDVQVTMIMIIDCTCIYLHLFAEDEAYIMTRKYDTFSYTFHASR